MRLQRFASRLILSYVLIIGIPFVFLAVILDRRLEDNSLQQIEASLANQARLMALQLQPADIRSPASQRLQDLAAWSQRTLNARMTVIDAAGMVVVDSDVPQKDVPALENHRNRPEVLEALRNGTGAQIRYSSTLKIDMLYLALALRSDNDQAKGVVRLALPLEHVRRTLAVTRSIIVAGLFFAVCLAVVIGSMLIRGISRPLERVLYGSRRFAAGNLDHRILVEGDDELGRLGSTLNLMAQDLQNQISRIELQNQQLQRVFESMVEGVILVDASMKILQLNPALARIFGLDPAIAQGRLFLEVLANNDLAELFGRVIQTNQAVSTEMTIVWPVRRQVLATVAPISEQARAVACLAVIHDITEMKKLQTIRSDFVANVSHELKTPLTSIKGFVDTLLDGGLDDKEHARSFVEIIQQHTDRLNALIQDLLALSYLESKEAVLRKEAVDLAELTQSVIKGFGAQLKSRQVSARSAIDGPCRVSADKHQLVQVLTNLVDNAIKFNRPGGSVTINCSIEQGRVKVSVADTGSGIPAKDLPRIFERFYRVDKARSRDLGGTGLGLAIVKHIVELHGGVVGVESAEAAGSTFWFTLPQ